MVEFLGAADLRRAAAELAAPLPEPLAPLARVAYNYRWSWAPDGPDTFAAIDPDRWERCLYNPVRLLSETPPSVLGRAALDTKLGARIAALAQLVDDDLARPFRTAPVREERPIAFLCAEFGVHGSLPVYSGGLGILAGDIVKEASDLGLAMVAVGIMYRTGYFHQRIDLTGYQHEYWLDADPDRLPCARVSGPDGQPLQVTVPLESEDLAVEVWRVDVGRVPLYLLDSDVAPNSLVGRWVTSRLYEGNRAIRLAQYAVLGVGGSRALRVMGIEPSVFHLNEGHPALAAVDLQAAERASGLSPAEAAATTRRRLVFTTHTPVPAGNETYGRDEVLGVLGRVGDLLGNRERLLALGRVHPDDRHEPSGMTPFAMRASRSINGVSRRHGEVAQAMWQTLIESGQAPPITSVTNGVHVPTWLQRPMAAVLAHHLGADWWHHAADPATWAPVDEIPDAELWAARCDQRAQWVGRLRARIVTDRLRRGEELSYVDSGAHGFAADRLTIGFARRVATYKRLHLLSLQPERASALLSGERAVQFVFAGKAHPRDEAAKAVVQRVFTLKGLPGVSSHVAFVEDFGLSLAPALVGGCDVWLNLPRPPMEASGTSGMKSCLNGGLQLSVLDGWWAEAYDGTNGWAIDGSVADDEEAQDREHAERLFDLLEQEVVPMFHERDRDGVPRRWVAMMKASLRTNGPRFSASRMVEEYAARIYPAP